MKKKTDWTAYYEAPKSKISTLTQKITTDYLVKCISSFCEKQDLSVVECGGGNSCFVDSLSKKFIFSKYDIIDNCELSLQKIQGNINVDSICNIDLASKNDVIDNKEMYDLVFSVGLLEHFSDEERKRVIQHHFELCKKGGYVLITVPTPTVKYRFIRKVMELMSLWQFWDETPIAIDDIKNELSEFGNVIYGGINSKLPLTQAMVMCKKN